MSFFNNNNYSGQPSTPVTTNLIIINVLVLLADAVMERKGVDLSSYLGLHYYDADKYNILQTVTYMFMHADFYHLFCNMFSLYMFGRLLEMVWGPQRFLIYYLVCGVGAGIVQQLAWRFGIVSTWLTDIHLQDPEFTYGQLLLEGQGILNRLVTVGASGSVCAMLAAIIMQPDQLVGLNLFVRTITTRMKWVALVVLLLTLFAGPAGNTGGLVCHVGGALFGFIYGYCYRQGLDITAWFSDGCQAIGQWIKDRNKPKMKATAGGRRDPISADKQKDMQYNTDKRQHEARIDEILDKISKHGYDGLTAEEKQMLFDASKRKKN